MKKFNWQIIAVVFFVVIGIVTRIYLVNKIPLLNRDEAAIGYNAYSILKTGKDEWGINFPLAFKSFGDYKMPGYIYASILPIRLFGLKPFSVRFISILSGILSVVLIYFLSLQLFKLLKLPTLISKRLSFLCSLLLLFNPWHLYFSRVGFEANLNLSLLLLGMTAFLYGLEKRKLLVVSALAFGLALYVYSSAFIFLPFFLLAFFFIFKKSLLSKKDFWIFISIMIFFVLAIHATWSVWQVSLAKANVTIFSDNYLIDKFNHDRWQVFSHSPLEAKLFFNKYFYFSKILLKNYLATFSVKFLLTGSNFHPWHQLAGIGNFYYFDIFFLILGMFWLIKKKNFQAKWLLLGWFFTAPLPSAITVDAPHSTRLLQILPVIEIISVLGVYQLYLWIKNKKKLFKILISFFVLFVYFSQIIFLLKTYFGENYILPPQPLLAKIDEAIDYVNKHDKDRLVIFSRPLDFPYIYVAFYTKFNPELFQKIAIYKPPDTNGLTAVESLGRYRFWEGVPEFSQKKAYYILQKQSIKPTAFNLKKEIRNKNLLYWNIFVN